MHCSPESWRHVHCGVDMGQWGCSSCLQRHVPYSHPKPDLTVAAGRANNDAPQTLPSLYWSFKRRQGC